MGHTGSEYSAQIPILKLAIKMIWFFLFICLLPFVVWWIIEIFVQFCAKDKIKWNKDA
jgi:hypothetical protein